LFLREVVGSDLRDFLDTKKDEIIEQDAKTLAALCLGGYRKQRFADFDDKLFDCYVFYYCRSSVLQLPPTRKYTKVLLCFCIVFDFCRTLCIVLS
jgi:hypothetical protein